MSGVYKFRVHVLFDKIAQTLENQFDSILLFSNDSLVDRMNIQHRNDLYVNCNAYFLTNHTIEEKKKKERITRVRDTLNLVK